MREHVHHMKPYEFAYPAKTEPALTEAKTHVTSLFRENLASNLKNFSKTLNIND